MKAIDITGSQMERDLVHNCESKPARMLGVLKDTDMPLPAGILEHLDRGEWIWKLEPETFGRYIGMYGGIWIKGNIADDKYNLVVFVSKLVYDTHIKSQIK